MILRLVPFVIPAFTQYARTFSPPQRVCRILPSLKCGWIWLSKSVVSISLVDTTILNQVFHNEWLMQWVSLSPVVPTSTISVFEKVEPCSIPHENFPCIDLRDELYYCVTVLTNSKILNYPNCHPWFSADEPKCDCKLLTMMMNCCFFVLVLQIQ